MANDRKVGNLLVQMRAELGGLRVDVKEMQNTFQQSFTGIQASAASAFRSIQTSIAAAFGSGVLVAAFHNLTSIGDQLSDLADQTGVTVAVLGGIKPIADQNNTSIDAFAKGMLKAQKELGAMQEGGEGAASSLKKLGLNVNDLKQLEPDKFIEVMAKALAGVENRSERAAIATQLFGKAGAELIPTLLAIAEKGLPRLSKEAEEGYKSLGRLKDKMVETTGEAFNLAAGFVHMLDVLLNVSELQKLKSALADVSEEIDAIDKRLETRKKLREGGFGFFTAPSSDDAEQLKRRAELLERLTDLGATLGKKREEKPQGTKILGIGDDGNAKALQSLKESIDKESDALQAQLIELRRGKEAAQDYALSQKELQERAKGVTAGILEEQRRRRELTKDLRDEQRAREELAGRVRAETLAKGPQEDTRGLRSFEELRQAQEALDKDYAEFRAQLAKDLADADKFWLDQELEQLRKNLAEQRQVWEGLGTSIQRSWDQTLNGIFSGTQSFTDGMKNMFRNMALAILSELGKLAGNALVNSLSGLFNGRPAGVEGPLLSNGGFLSGGGNILGGLLSQSTGGSIFSGIGNFFGGIFDDGGMVPGRIGEPKLVMAHGGETILPTHKGGGFGQVVYNIDARGAQRGVSAEIQRAIDKSRAQAVRQSVGAVKTERERSHNFASAFGSK